MVKHVVLFRFRDDVDAETRAAAASAFKSGILALKAVIPTIRKIDVGFNINASEQWDICLYSEFDSLEDALAYGRHPEHVKVASALKPLIAGRSCVDYE